MNYMVGYEIIHVAYACYMSHTAAYLSPPETVD